MTEIEQILQSLYDRVIEPSEALEQLIAISKTDIQAEIIAKQDELITILDQASIRGWTNIMQKHKMNFYDEIADLRQQLKQAEAEPVKNLASGQAWICPRCQKVHSWLSMTCDCEPRTITSTTY